MRSWCPNRSAGGFTLLELVVVLGILSGFLMMLVQFVDSGVRLFDAGESAQALADRAEQARTALSRELRKITADCRRIEPGLPRDRLLVQMLPLGLPARSSPQDPHAFVLRAGIALMPAEEEALQYDALLVRAILELGAGADRTVLAERARELQRQAGLRGRGRLLLAMWPQSEDGALLELRAMRLLEEQQILVGETAVDPFVVPVPGTGELPTLALHSHTEVLVADLLHAELQFWSQATRSWTDSGSAGPQLVWDSARAGWLAEATSGPRFAFDKGPESLFDPADDVHPHALRVLLVVAEDASRPLDGLLADALEADATTAVFVNGDRFPGDPAGGFAKIGGEWVQYGERRGDLLRSLRRGQRGTRPTAHAAGAAVRVGRSVEFTIALPHGRDDWNG